MSAHGPYVVSVVSLWFNSFSMPTRSRRTQWIAWTSPAMTDKALNQPFLGIGHVSESR
jgi:hypothetical protein